MIHRLRLAEMSAVIFIPALVFVALSMVSCGDEKKTEPPPDLTKFSGIYESYLKKCSECHTPDSVAYSQKVGNLDMSTADNAYASLIQAVQLKRQLGADCAVRKYIEAGNPNKSYLYAIMDTPTREAFAAGSDSLCTPLLHVAEFDSSGNNVGGVANQPKPEEKKAIREWIEKGAPKD